MLVAACAFLLGARVSDAHTLEAALATPDCGTSTIQLHFTGNFMDNGPFSVPYTIAFNCTDGGPAIPSISETATGTVVNAVPGVVNGTFDITVTQAAALAGRTCLVSGTATLFQGGVQYNTVAITDPAGLTEFKVECAPPPRVTGCTPGYWKQDQHFDSWPSGVTPSQYLKQYFTGTIPLTFGGKSLGNIKLLDGLKMKGGSGLEGARQILMRAAVAAYLNSLKNFNYQFSTSEVVNMVNTALASSSRDLIILTAAKLDLANNAGCPLN